MIRRRSYRQFCGVARALDVVGERWTLLVVRNLLLGPRRYTDLLAELPGITTNLLAKRLQDMEAAGLVAKGERANPAGALLYALTAAGEALEPVVMELGRWGGHLMDRPRAGDRVDLALGLLSLKRRYRGGLSLTVALDTGERQFGLRFQPDRLTVRDRGPDDAQLSLAASEPIFRALFTGQSTAAALAASGKLRLRGTSTSLGDMVSALGLPG